MYSFLAWANNCFFFDDFTTDWDFFLYEGDKEWREKKKLFSFSLVFQVKLFNISCTDFSTEIPWNLHTLWHILTIVFQYNY